MKNIVRFLADSKLAVVAIIFLLICQAYCDLALPGYTSDILNVGLQQGGIENAVMNTVREDSIEQLELFMTDEDVQFLEDSYSEADKEGIRTLKKDVNQEKLNDILLIPESVLFQMEYAESGDKKYSLDDMKKAIQSGMMTKEQLQQEMTQGIDKLGDLSDTILSQIAVKYVSREYEAQGLDLDEIRNHYLMLVGAKMLTLSLFMTIAAIFTGLIAAIVSARIGKNLRQALYEKVMKFTNEEMEELSTASLITRATNDIQQIQMVTVLLLRMVSYAPILAIGGIIKVAHTNSGMSWIIVLAVVVLCSCVGILVGISMPKFKKMQSLVDRLNLVSREMLGGIMPIRAFSREKYEEQRFDTANRDLFETQLFTNRAMSIMSPFMMFIMNGISVLIVWVGAHRVEEGAIQIGDLTAFITYSMVIVMGFLLISMISIFLPRAGIAADRIAEVIDKEIVLHDPAEPEDDAFGKGKGIVKFDNVSFSYPGAEELALTDISFVAEPGKTTAIIGSTGSGKTTLLNLIPRFYDVTDGAITIDGYDIRNITQHKLRETIGYVPQRGMLFSGTIETNLKYGGDNITDEEMKNAAEIAQAIEFIQEKEDKYDSAIAQEGTNVSGGQRQRLSIARAIAKNPKIFLFDDSFSALDYKTDLALRKALADRVADATVIIVAQRISTILHADQIIVLDDGVIVGKGTHKELLANCETYQEIAKSQLSEKELSGGVKGGQA